MHLGVLMTPIKYIGHRATYRDGAFGTGIEFSQGGTEMVPDDKARLMLRHPSVYVLGDGVATHDASSPVEDVDSLQDSRDAVMAMDKDALKNYAKTHYRINLDGRMSVGDMRTKVVGLIDQYGID